MVHAVIGGSEYYISDLDVTYSLCSNRGTTTFYVDVGKKSEINPFEEVQVIANNEVIFTGVIDTVTRSAFPRRLEIQGVSRIVQAERCWFSTEYVSNGESGNDWISVFMNLAQIPSYSISGNDGIVYEGHSLGFMTCLEAIKNLIQISDTRLYPVRNGTVVVAPPNTSGANPHTFNLYEHAEVTATDASIRNRAVVFGVGVTADITQSSAYLVPGEVRTAAISTGLIETLDEATRVANRILGYFNKPMEIISLRVDGYPTVNLNDYAYTPFGEGAITSIKHQYDAQRYTTTITVGEVCPSFFGLSVLKDYIPLYFSGVNLGVWKSINNGNTWFNISGGTLYGKTVHAIHFDGTYLWAITTNGIYRGVGGSTWTTCSILDEFYLTKDDENYHFLRENMQFADIITDQSGDRVFVVGQDSESKKLFVLFSENKYLFNRIFMV